MIIFLTGTWGSGKSYVGDLIQENCGLLHVEADVHFDKSMLAAIHARNFHTMDHTVYYNKVISDIFNYEKRSTHVVVSQGIYQERYRKMIYDCFQPNIHFIWVKMENERLLRGRLMERSSTGNPITPEVYDYMNSHWEDLQIPHSVLVNEGPLEEKLAVMLYDLGLCFHWFDELGGEI